MGLPGACDRLLRCATMDLQDEKAFATNALLAVLMCLFSGLSGFGAFLEPYKRTSSKRKGSSLYLDTITHPRPLLQFANMASSSEHIILDDDSTDASLMLPINNKRQRLDIEGETVLSVFCPFCLVSAGYLADTGYFVTDTQALAEMLENSTTGIVQRNPELETLVRSQCHEFFRGMHSVAESANSFAERQHLAELDRIKAQSQQRIDDLTNELAQVKKDFAKVRDDLEAYKTLRCVSLLRPAIVLGLT